MRLIELPLIGFSELNCKKGQNFPKRGIQKISNGKCMSNNEELLGEPVGQNSGSRKNETKLHEKLSIDYAEECGNFYLHSWRFWSDRS
jgi:hypothetical protein